MYFIIKSVRDSGSLWRACHLQSGQSSLHIPTARDGQSLVLPRHLLKCSSPRAIKKTPSFKSCSENVAEGVHYTGVLYSICEISVADTEALLLFNTNYRAINRCKKPYLF